MRLCSALSCSFRNPDDEYALCRSCRAYRRYYYTKKRVGDTPTDDEAAEVEQLRVEYRKERDAAKELTAQQPIPPSPPVATPRAEDQLPDTQEFREACRRYYDACLREVRGLQKVRDTIRETRPWESFQTG